jgi:hypothetical protein
VHDAEEGGSGEVAGEGVAEAFGHEGDFGVSGGVIGAFYEVGELLDVFGEVVEGVGWFAGGLALEGEGQG